MDESTASFDQLMEKVTARVVHSFQLRNQLYVSDIRRLDSLRGLPKFDFRQLFLVKESLGLMYQMMQLPDRGKSLTGVY
jgi:hypothetical protein